MSKILLSGYYGFNNLGDEAILEAITDRLKKTDLQITAFSNNPEETSQKLGIRSVERNVPKILLKEIMATDILLSGGGSLLQDSTSSRSIIYYLLIILTARLFGKKVIVYSQGIGPINGKLNRFLSKIVLRTVNILIVREPNSKKDLIELGIKESKIHVTADPVLGMSAGTKTAGADLIAQFGSFDRYGRSVGICVRTKDFKSEDMYGQFIDFLNRISSNYSIVLLPFYAKMDMEIAQRIKEDLPQSILLDRELGTREMLDAISSVDALVGSRLHSLIFASVCSTPVIGISYDPKIDYFLETMGLKAACTVDSIDSGVLTDQLSLISANEDEFRQLLRNAVEKEREKLFKNDELIEKLSLR